MKKTPLKRGKTGLKKISEKSLKAVLKEQEEKHKMYDFFQEIFDSTPPEDRRCQSCGKLLQSPAKSFYFDHLIEKSKRPDLKLEKDNIFLTCFTCHALKTDGHPTEDHQKAIEKAKERFGIS